MNSVTSALNMVHIFYLVNYGLSILMMNHIYPIIIIISSRIELNMLFKTKDVIKISRCDRKIHKSIRIPVEVHEINKRFTVTVQPRNACKLEFIYHLWLPVLDQPKSDIVVFSNN